MSTTPPTRPIGDSCVVAGCRLPAGSAVWDLSRAGSAVLGRQRVFRAIAAAAWIVAAAFSVRAFFGTPVWPAACAGAAIIVARLFRPPSGVAVLAEIDRRLGLHELLSSAASLGGTDPATQLVQEQAEHRARTIDARVVFQDPQPARALTTAAVALAASIALSLTLVRSNVPPIAEPRAESAPNPPASPLHADVIARRDSDSPRSFGTQAEAVASAARSTSSDGSAGGSRDNVGASAATSAMPTPATPRMANAANPASSGAAGRDVSGDAGLVGIVGDAGPKEGIAARGTLALSAANAIRTSAIADSSSNINATRVPSESRDLVRAFFTPDDEGRP